MGAFCTHLALKPGVPVGRRFSFGRLSSAGLKAFAPPIGAGQRSTLGGVADHISIRWDHYLESRMRRRILRRFRESSEQIHPRSSGPRHTRHGESIREWRLASGRRAQFSKMPRLSSGAFPNVFEGIELSLFGMLFGVFNCPRDRCNQPDAAFRFSRSRTQGNPWCSIFLSGSLALRVDAPGGLAS